MESTSCHVRGHSSRLWGLGGDNLGKPYALTHTKNKTSSLDNQVPFIALNSSASWAQHRVQQCLPAFRLLPVALALPLTPARPAEELLQTVLGISLAAEFPQLPLPCLAGLYIHHLGPSWTCFRLQKLLDPSLISFPWPIHASSPNQGIFLRAPEEVLSALDEG